MNKEYRWWREERADVGVDFCDLAVTAKYDEDMSRYRDAAQEFQLITEALGLSAASTVIDMGAGTGTFAMLTAEVCRRVYAVDLSPAMLDRIRLGSLERGLTNIECHQAGLLSYRHRSAPVDAIVCQSVLHHVPDFWKMVALRRMSGMLKSDGMVYLMDVVFSFGAMDYERSIQGELKAVREKFGANAADEYAGHFREEFSTFDWVMEGLLQRAGFEISSAEYHNEFAASYVCRKDP